MEYESLEEKIQQIFRLLDLSQEERQIMMKAYLEAGSSETSTHMTSKQRSTKSLIQSLSEKGLIFIKKSGKEKEIYPIPLSLLIQKRKSGLHDEERRMALDALRGIDKWIKYPIQMDKKLLIKSSNENKVIISWIFELLRANWETVYCFGDYESFIETFGTEAELEWIKERARCGKKASVIATQDGQWAQRIHSLKQQELRECKINPQSFSDLFIMAFPDINTTLMASSDGEITFVQSDSFSKQYSHLVKASI